jgi:long-chain acyl-CoA synthetase
MITVPHLSELVSIQVKKYGNKPALWSRDEATATWKPYSWIEFDKHIKIAAKALFDKGVRPKQNIAIYSQNKIESFVVDFAAFQVRASVVPLYATSSTEQVQYIADDAEVEIIFVGEQFQYDNAYEAQKISRSLKRIVVFDDTVKTHGEETTVLFKDFMKNAESSSTDVAEEMKNTPASDNDIATIIYTSGTTGASKGVMLMHYNYREVLRIHNERLVSVTDKDRSLNFLPISHIFERAWCYFCLLHGIEVYVNLHPQDVQKVITEVHPTLMCAVPRFWEKVYIAVKQRLFSMSPIMRGVVIWGVSVGEHYNLRCLRKGRKPSVWLRLQYKLADKMVFSKVKKTLGIENANFFPVAGASLSNEIIIFLRSIGIPIMYGYGLTETTATVCCYPYDHYMLGSVGSKMPDVDVKIGDDDEILVKGGTVTPGYYKRPEETKAAFTADGYFRTGDAGRLEGNNLILTERIKDLFKTSNGKYIAPQQIEMRLLSNLYIDQVAVIGDRRNYVTAIVAPAIDAIKQYAETANIQCDSIDGLLRNEQIKQFLLDQITESQKDMASYEVIKKIAIIKKPFTLEGGELTNTLKLRRAVIVQKYASLIEDMYKTKK